MLYLYYSGLPDHNASIAQPPEQNTRETPTETPTCSSTVIERLFCDFKTKTSPLFATHIITMKGGKIRKSTNIPEENSHTKRLAL